ncbi:hypothetical protein LCGC14_0711510 [marine sediment metagenome]|uniref:Uncharacterized protein n=1 Tax=marine sediment metagenome TaxID=412755 RepID=A0A0F9T0H9_9ZZZZ
MANEYIHDLDAIGAVDDGSLLAIEDTGSPTDLKKVTAATFQAYLTINVASQVTGTLAVTNGGTGNATLTADRVLLSNLTVPTAAIAVSTITRTELETLNNISSNIQDQIDGILDGCTFTGDVGIGVAPSVPLHVGSDSDCSVYFDEAVDATGGVDFRLRKARNTMASPTAVLANDLLGGLSWYGYDGSSYDYGAGIRTLVSAIAAGNLSTSLEFRTVSAGSAATNMTLNKDGDLTILGDLYINGGDISAGVDITTQGVLKLYGDNAGGGGASYWYNSDNDDGTVEYWKMIPTGIGAANAMNLGPDTDPNAFVFSDDGDFTIAGDLTGVVGTFSGAVSGVAGTFTGNLISGVDDTTQGLHRLYGDNGANGGASYWYNGVTDHGVVQYWKLQPTGIGAANELYLGPDTDPNAFVFSDDGDFTIAGDLTASGGNVFAGADDVTRGSLFAYGNNSTLNGRLFLFNSADNDTNEEYYIFSAAGDNLNIGPENYQSALVLSRLGDLTIAGDFALSGTVDGVDIAARDHAESHTHDSHTGTLSVNEGGTGVTSFSADRVLLSNLTTPSGDLRVSPITGVELNYLNNVNSNIRTHMDNSSAHHTKYSPSGSTTSFVIGITQYNFTNGLMTSFHTA